MLGGEEFRGERQHAGTGGAADVPGHGSQGQGGDGIESVGGYPPGKREEEIAMVKDPPFLMGKSRISMAMFNSYVSLLGGMLGWLGYVGMKDGFRMIEMGEEKMLG